MMWSLVQVWMIPLDWESRAHRRKNNRLQGGDKHARDEKILFFSQPFIFSPKCKFTRAQIQRREKREIMVRPDRRGRYPRIIWCGMCADTSSTQLGRGRGGRNNPSMSGRAVGSVWPHLCWIASQREKWGHWGICATPELRLGGGCGWILFGEGMGADKRDVPLPACQLYVPDEWQSYWYQASWPHPSFNISVSCLMSCQLSCT